MERTATSVFMLVTLLIVTLSFGGYFYCTVAVVRCPELSSPVNGVKTGNRTLVGSQVLFDCNHCFELRGPSNLTCLQEERWNGQQPTCERLYSDQFVHI